MKKLLLAWCAMAWLAGCGAQGGMDDAGVTVDGSVPMEDAGQTSDAGSDGGVDAGTDAGMTADTTAPVVTLSSATQTAPGGAWRLEGSATDDVGITSVTWSFAGGSANPLTLSGNAFAADVTLPNSGVVTVTARDAAGNEGTANITVTVPVSGLVAAFTTSTSPSPLTPVRFDASPTMAPGMASFTAHWDFGDGSTAEGVHVGHLFRVGTYTVRLTARLAGGEEASVTQQVVVAEPTPMGTASVALDVTDADGGPVGRVVVADRSGAPLGETDAEGRCVFSAGVGVPQVFTLKRADYTTQVLRLELPATTTTARATAVLLPRALPVTLADAAAGGTVTGMLGARITFPAAGLVDDATGAPVTGPVAVTMTPVDHRTAQTRAFPGPFLAPEADGTLGPLVSFGLMEVTLTQNGRKVQVAPGATATVDIPYTVTGGQAGDVRPFFTLDETTGLWRQEQAAVPLVAATQGNSLVQRVEVSHFSWVNIDQLATTFPGLSFFSIDVNFEVGGQPAAEPVDLESDYSDCFGARVVILQRRVTTVRHSVFPANCNVSMSAWSSDGRYRGSATVNRADGATPITVDLDDTYTLPLLQPNTPVTVPLAAAQTRMFGVDATAGSAWVVRARSVSGATLTGTVALLPIGAERARRPDLFNAAGDTLTRFVSPDAGRWLVVLNQLSGTGDVTLELLPSTSVPLDEQPTQTVSLGTGAQHDFVVRASQADVVRFVASGGTALSLSVLDARAALVFSAAASATDSGAVRFPAGGFFIVRVANTGAPTMATVTRAVAPPPVALTPAPHSRVTGTLEAAGLRVFFVPQSNGAGLVAHAQRVAPTGVAPQVALHTFSQGPFPQPSLTERQARASDDSAAMAAMRLPVVTNAAEQFVTLTVSTPGNTATGDFTLDVSTASPAAALRAGTCSGAHTPSLVAAALALADDGVLTACAERHDVLAGLRFAEPRFTLRGLDRTTTVLAPWPGAPSVVATGTYGASSVIFTTRATVEDVTLLNTPGNGLALAATSGSAFNVTRVTLEAPALVTAGSGNSTCLTASTSPGTMSSVRFEDSRCTHVQEAMQLTSIDTVTVTDSTFDTTVRGLNLNNPGTTTITGNTFTSAPQALLLQQARGAVTVTSNSVTQGANGTTALSVTLRNQSPTPAVTSVLSDNSVTLQGTSAIGVAAGFNAANGDLRIDGNLVVGSGGTQVGIRLLATLAGVTGGNVRVQNNVVRDVGSHALHVLQADSYTRLDVFNNTLRAPAADTVSESVINLGQRTTGASAPLNVINNIVVGGGGTGVGVAYVPSLAPTRAHNLLFSVGQPYRPTDGSMATAGLNDIVGQDPVFTDDALRVAANSPAVGAGTSTDAPASAFGGGPRLVSAIDIGAHER